MGVDTLAPQVSGGEAVPHQAGTPASGPAEPGTAEAGTAVVEFVLVGTLFLALFLAFLQLALALHVRNTLVACAAEGARYGANADRTPHDGAELTRTLISEALSPRFASGVTSGYEPVNGAQTVVIEVRTVLPLAGWYGPRRLGVQGHALEEGG